jgi:hypothetical protein
MDDARLPDQRPRLLERLGPAAGEDLLATLAAAADAAELPALRKALMVT